VWANFKLQVARSLIFVSDQSVLELRRSGKLRYWSILLILFVHLFVAKSVVSQGPNYESAELVEAVLEATKSNTEKLGVVFLVLTETVTPSPAMGDSSSQIKLVTPGGQRISFTPLSSPVLQRFEMLIDRDGFFERRNYGPSEELNDVWQYNEGKWLHYQFPEKTLVIRNPDQLPSFGSVDPRQPAAVEFGSSFRRFLESAQLVEGLKLSDELGEDVVRLTIAGKLTSQRCRIEYSAATRYLPVSSILYSTDGVTPLIEQNFKYQLIEQRDALVLSEVRAKYRTDLSLDDNEQRGMYFEGEKVVSVDRYDLLEGDDLSRRRTIAGDDWSVNDVTDWEKKMAESKPLPVVARQDSSWSRMFFLVNVVVLLAILIVVFRKKFTRS